MSAYWPKRLNLLVAQYGRDGVALRHTTMGGGVDPVCFGGDFRVFAAPVGAAVAVVAIRLRQQGCKVNADSAACSCPVVKIVTAARWNASCAFPGLGGKRSHAMMRQ